MKKKLLLLPLFLLVLAACGPSTSEPDSTPGTSQPGTSQPGTSVTSEEDSLPPPPSSSSISETQATSIADARKLAKDTTVTVEGVVTAIYGMASSTHAIILQDGGAAITLPFIDPTLTADLAKGDVLRATGKINPFNGLIQLSNSTFTKLSSTSEPIVPLTLTEADWTVANLEDLDGLIVRVEGLKHVSGTVDTTKNSPITVKLGAKEFAIYVSNYIALTEKEALKAKFDSVRSYDTITFEGPLGQYNDMQLNPVSADTITVVAGTPTGPVLPTSLAFSTATIELQPEATYQTVLTRLPVDAVLDGLVYASSNELIATVSETGLVTAHSTGVANITATVGEISATLMVTVAIPTTEKLWSLDFSSAATWISDNKTTTNYSYGTTYDVVMKDGDVEMDWALRGVNPNNWSVPAVRFGSKSSNAKLDEIITAGLPMDAALAHELGAVFAEAKDPVAGTVHEVVVNVFGDFGPANFTREKVYLQASTTVDFATPINLGSKDAVNGKIKFELESGLENHYFRVIIGLKNTVDSNGGLLIQAISFNKLIAAPEAPKVKVGLANLFTGKAIDEQVVITEGYVLWNRYADTTLVVGTAEGTALVSYFNSDAGSKATFESVVKGDYVTMTLKIAANGNGGNFARANIGVPQLVGGFLFVKAAEPTWQFDGMTEATNVYDLTQGLNWLSTYTTADLGTYVRVTGKNLTTANDQFYLEFEARVEGMNSIGASSYIRLSAYKSNLLGFNLEIGKTYTIEGVIGGVNQNLPLTGTNNPIFRLYAQSVTEVI